MPRFIKTTSMAPLALAAVLAVPLVAALPTAAQAQAQVAIVIPAPPPPRAEVMPPPRRGYVWAPGHWEWRHGHHVWMNGVWVRERRGYVYRAPAWNEVNGRWVYSTPRWDRDGDGIPNNRDRHPNDPRR